jgi:uncharacterized protein
MEELSIDEARGLMLAAQGLLDPPPGAVDLAEVRGIVERLGVVQIDTISVVARSQYLVLWSRLGPYDPGLLDRLLHPERAVLEYWAHAASILPMRDYAYHRAWMLHHQVHMWSGHREWADTNAAVLEETLETIRVRGPVASADFERDPSRPRSGPWDWHGPKLSRRALEVLWTSGRLMVSSRRAGQKVYDLHERVVTELDGLIVGDHALPDLDARRRYLARRTLEALGVVLPSWLFDYFRLSPPVGMSKKAGALALLRELEAAGAALPARIEGLDEPAFVAASSLPDLARLRAGVRPERTTLLSPFDSLIWDRARARALFGYEVVFEAYVPPPKRRYGYYVLAILHRGRLVGRLDPKMDRAGKRLLVRALHLEPGVRIDDDLLDGLAGTLCDLAHFLGGSAVIVGQATEQMSDEDRLLAGALVERLEQHV